MAEVTFDVRQPIKVLSRKESGWKKELNVVSWNKGPAKLDIREWNADRSKMKKGITLTREEAVVLRNCLEQLDYSYLPEKISFVTAEQEYSKKAPEPAPVPEETSDEEPDVSELPEAEEEAEIEM